MHLFDVPAGTAFVLGSDPHPHVVLSHSDSTGYSKVLRYGSERHLSLESSMDVKIFRGKRRTQYHHPLGFKIASVPLLDIEVSLVVTGTGEPLYVLPAVLGGYRSAKTLNGILVEFLSYRVAPEDCHLPMYLLRMLGVE